MRGQNFAKLFALTIVPKMAENTCISFDKLVKNSETFFEKNTKPTTNNYANDYVYDKLFNETPGEEEKKDKIAKFANEAHPLVHEKSLQMAEKFLQFKKEQGSLLEMEIYKNMGILAFIDRLICKRPLVFVNPTDNWKAKDSKGQGPSDSSPFYWDNIGTAEDENRKMENFLTYDEIKVAALIMMSSQTMLINNGDRYNNGIRNQEEFIEEAVYVGAVGARFERAGKMEYQDIIVEKDQNLSDYGYGSKNEKPSVLNVFAESLYNTSNFPSFDEIKNKQVQMDHYEKVETRGDVLFNTAIYKMRIKLVLEPFLLEANKRGIDSNRKVYCHVVGLGLGVWELYQGQKRHFLAAFSESLKEMKGILHHISDIDFSYIDEDDINELKDGKNFPETEIRIHFSRRNPFDILPKETNDKLVVAMFAWDGNSYVGNEYWAGMLSSSGDPAAACCSLIPELMNPDINPNANGYNLHVASPDFGVLPFTDYEKRMLDQTCTNKL